jgi:Smg protein
MFDVLVYLYENYWRPDACPDSRQLTRKLTAVGFEDDDIQEALSWLEGLSGAADAVESTQHPNSQRFYTDDERQLLGDECIGFIQFLESAEVLSPALREMVVDRATAVGSGRMDLEEMKIIVLMVFWSLGEEPDALILDELFVDPQDRLIH